MLSIIYDSSTCARVQVCVEVLEVFLGTNELDFAAQRRELSSRGGVVIDYKNRVRIKRLKGSGWYQISGYRQDGQDLSLALFTLRNSERIYHIRKAAQKYRITLDDLT